MTRSRIKLRSSSAMAPMTMKIILPIGVEKGERITLAGQIVGEETVEPKSANDRLVFTRPEINLSVPTAIIEAALKTTFLRGRHDVRIRPSAGLSESRDESSSAGLPPTVMSNYGKPDLLAGVFCVQRQRDIAAYVAKIR